MYHSSPNFKSLIKVLPFLEYVLIKVLMQFLETNSGKVIQLDGHYKTAHLIFLKMPITTLYLVGIKLTFTFLLG